MRRNNFDVLRLFFAACVIYSHTYALLGRAEPVLWGRTAGAFGVLGFFALSGFLITKSMLRSKNSTIFLSHRFLRIVPGLAVALLFSTAVGTLSNNFEQNPVPFITNGPIWTLTWETICYLGVLVFYLLGILSPKAFSAVFVSSWIVFSAHSSSTDDFYRAIIPMFLVFGAGALFAVRPTGVSKSVFITASVALALTFDFHFFEAFVNMASPYFPLYLHPDVSVGFIYICIVLVSLPPVIIGVGTFRPLTPRIPQDLSYGLYIYGWPIAQLIVYWSMKLELSLAAWQLFSLTMVIALVMAFLSWNLIERPALSLKRFVDRRFAKE